MRKRLLKDINYIAIFFLGISSPILVHVGQITYFFIFKPQNRGAAVSGFYASMPWNIIAGTVFIGSLAFIVVYSRKQGRNDIKVEEERNKTLALMIRQSVKDGIKDAIIELNLKQIGGQSDEATKNE